MYSFPHRNLFSIVKGPLKLNPGENPKNTVRISCTEKCMVILCVVIKKGTPPPPPPPPTIPLGNLHTFCRIELHLYLVIS